MSLDFNIPHCKTQSNKKMFGLCDDPPPNRKPAYIDEVDGSKWIAVVGNDKLYPVDFIAIDNCIEITREDGRMEKRCDGLLKFETTTIFVELKQRKGAGIDWIKEAENQLKTTITYFEHTADALKFSIKKAYICNSEHPKFRNSQASRMDQFLDDTGYVLRIENRIEL